MKVLSVIHIILMLILAPLLPGIINRVKALFAGRRGQPVLQLYYDIFKLLRKGCVYSTSTSWIFRSAPVLCLSMFVAASILIPYGSCSSLISFKGDIILFAYLLAAARFSLVLAALDTGSSFEGMGASREVMFAALAEPAFLIAILAVMCKGGGDFSLSAMTAWLNIHEWMEYAPAYILVSAALFIVLLTENSRVPIDDPNTHLELTMIHEVMVLDYSGPDFAFILYGAALKLWIFGTLIAELIMPFNISNPFTGILVYLSGMLFVGIIVGITESIMARFSFLKIPQLLLAATAMSITALILMLRY